MDHLSENVNCHPADFFSGFYRDPLPVANVSAVRSPRDVAVAVKKRRANRAWDPS